MTTQRCDSLDAALGRLGACVDRLERAVERRMRQVAAHADALEELTLLQDDRARLAVELDSALGHAHALEQAGLEAGKRIASAEAAIEAALSHSESAPQTMTRLPLQGGAA